MKIFKNVLLFFLVLCTPIVIGLNYNKKSLSAISTQTTPIKVAVLLFGSTDRFISIISDELKNIEKQNPGQVQYTFYDAKFNQEIQNEQINKVLEEGVDLILLNLVNRESTPIIINRIKERNIPVILFNREPITPLPIQAYDKGVYIGTNSKDMGILQGRMLVDAWKTSSFYIDKNYDKIMQYVILHGEIDNPGAIERTTNSISTIKNAGISTQQLSVEICNWREDLAYDATKKLLLEHSDEIEVIIANNDAMAIGAIKALQEQGYNLGNKSNTIPVIGVDLIPEAQKLIDDGYMLGSALNDPKAYAEALYIVGMNLVARRNPLEGTNYEFDETRVFIRIPSTEFLYRNIFLEF